MRIKKYRIDCGNVNEPDDGFTTDKDKKCKIDWSYLLDQLPDLIWRSRWDDLAAKYGLPFKRSYMQNLDSEGKGPEKKYLKERVGYPRAQLIEWLNSL